LILVSCSSIAFFSDVRIESLSQRLGNDKVKCLIESFEDIVARRVANVDGNSHLSRQTGDLDPGMGIMELREVTASYLKGWYSSSAQSMWPLTERQLTLIISTLFILCSIKKNSSKEYMPITWTKH
jgi:hypothetical protein